MDIYDRLCKVFQKHQRISRAAIDEMVQKNLVIIIADNGVYDITNYVVSELHKPGNACILKKNGKDCSIDFGFHSANANKLLEKFYIGKLAD